MAILVIVLLKTWSPKLLRSGSSHWQE